MRDAHVERILAAEDRRLLDLYDVRVTMDGPETPDVAQVADQLRTMIAGIAPTPEFLVVGPKRNRAARRRDAARQRTR